MNVHLHIESLVLDGIPLAPYQRPQLQAAVEAELTRLLAEGGLAPGLAQGGALDHVAGEAIRPSPADSSARLGQQIAQAVYGGIGS